MIDYIIGKVFRKNGLSATILANESIGYEVFVPLCYFQALKLNETIALDIVHIQKEDGRETLYGFLDLDSKNFFKSLITVDGIGDKKAFSILMNNEPKEMIRMIKEKDLVSLKKVKGVGPKTAQKIIESLEGKVEIKEENSIFTEAREALLGLGLSAREVNGFIDKLNKNKEYTIEEIIQAALTA